MSPVPEGVSSVVKPVRMSRTVAVLPQAGSTFSIPQMARASLVACGILQERAAFMQQSFLLAWPCPLLKSFWPPGSVGTRFCFCTYICTPTQHLLSFSEISEHAENQLCKGPHGPPLPCDCYSWWSFRLLWLRIHCFWGFYYTVSAISFLSFFCAL